jgi:hypothetical protein
MAYGSDPPPAAVRGSGAAQSPGECARARLRRHETSPRARLLTLGRIAQQT